MTSRHMFNDRSGDPRRIRRRIRRILEVRNAMHVGELCQRLDIPEGFMRRILEEMRAMGEVELLRPIGYDGSDHDFYRLSERNDVRVAATGIVAPDRPVRLAREAMACV